MLKNKRMQITISDKMAEEIENLKRNQFYNTSYSYLCKTLMKIGIEQLKNENKKINLN